MREAVFFLFVFNLSLSQSVPSFLSEDEINHNQVRIERDDAEPCNEDSLMNFLAEIQVINPESIVKLATTNEIASSCLKVAENLDKIRSYLKTCSPSSESDLYLQLIKGVESLHGKICTDSSFKKRFDEIHKCLYELRNDLEDCGGPADWNENSDTSAVCKAYKDISDCYFIKTAEVCGKTAAAITKELLQTIINDILPISCTNVRPNPPVKNPMPDEYIKKSKADSIKPSIVLYVIIITIVTLI